MVITEDDQGYIDSVNTIVLIIILQLTEYMVYIYEDGCM